MKKYAEAVALDPKPARRFVTDSYGEEKPEGAIVETNRPRWSTIRRVCYRREADPVNRAAARTLELSRGTWFVTPKHFGYPRSDEVVYAERSRLIAGESVPR